MAGNTTSRSTHGRGIWPLRLLNMFMADLQAGVGPFLGVYLLAHGWQSGLIGTVITIGSIVGLAVGIPAGALIDASSAKRAFVVAATAMTVGASVMVLAAQDFWTIAASQILSAIAGAALGPAVTGITLGMVRHERFNRQIGQNQAFNHAGNLIGAAVSGLLGWLYGLPAVFLLAGLFGVLTMASVLMIPKDAINHKVARGMHEEGEQADTVSGLSALWRNKPLLVLSLCLACFHLGNGAMLPLYGLAVVSAKQGGAAVFTALTVMVAQGTMIVTSLLAMHAVERRGYWLIVLISFAALPLRGVVAALSTDWWGVFPVQILDGIGAGLQSVAIPGLVAGLLYGTGRINTGIAAVMTVQGIGAARSPAIGGWLAQEIGYTPMFLILGGFALVSVTLWVVFRSSLGERDRPPPVPG